MTQPGFEPQSRGERSKNHYELYLNFIQFLYLKLSFASLSLEASNRKKNWWEDHPETLVKKKRRVIPYSGK